MQATDPRVVLVHPNPTVRDLLEARLRNAGFVPFSAGDCTEGLDAVRKHRPFLAFIDMGLPREAARALADSLTRTEAPPVQVCIVEDSFDRMHIEPSLNRLCLTRGQVLHPAFPMHLMNRITRVARKEIVA